MLTNLACPAGRIKCGEDVGAMDRKIHSQNSLPRSL